VGRASVVDGDTLEIHSKRIRLWGVDAPESSQLCRDDDAKHFRCGARAANDLDAFIGDRPVTCIEVEQDRHGRRVGVCTVDNTDLADWLVRNGLAFDWTQYSGGAYADAQRDAEQNERGLWAGTFVMPWQFRACLRNRGRASKRSDLSLTAIQSRLLPTLGSRAYTRKRRVGGGGFQAFHLIASAGNETAIRRPLILATSSEDSSMHPPQAYGGWFDAPEFSTMNGDSFLAV
jgi:endonuclease YncB( thermonuclease family)